MTVPMAMTRSPSISGMNVPDVVTRERLERSRLLTSDRAAPKGESADLLGSVMASSSRMLKNAEPVASACHSQEQPGGVHARRRSASGRDVQLRGPRATGSGGPPPAGDPHDGRYGAP